MSDRDYRQLVENYRQKIEKSFFLVESSLEDLPSYELEKIYTPKELEPYDALADRFIRCVEVFLKFFKALEFYKFSVASDTIRDGLNVMEKLELITSTPLWMNMRNVRNRILHDYLPEQTKDMFDSIMGEFYSELAFSRKKIASIEL